nr:MAG TPA: hypothetical protein [Caudoviricetes sp.]
MRIRKRRIKSPKKSKTCSPNVLILILKICNDRGFKKLLKS